MSAAVDAAAQTLELPGLKFATPRDYSRPTRGTTQALFSSAFLSNGPACRCGDPAGTLMPFQRYIADVSGELGPDGLPVYRLVIVTGPRQIGKSHLALVRKGERALQVPNFRGWYTAQTGSDARDQFLKFNDDVIAGQPLAQLVRTLRGNGHESMTFLNSKGSIRPHPPTDKALHGKQSDDNDIDEAWAFSREDGRTLMQAIAPTQLTRPGAQTFIWSAGGTAASTWLADYVARGREGDPTICYIELGVPDDLDINDLDAVAHYHPAYGHTIDRGAIEALRAQLPDDGEFARAAGNRWTEVIGGVIPASVWAAVQEREPVPDTGAIGYGAAREADGSQVAIAAAVDVDGVPVVEVLDVLPSGYRAAERVLHWSVDGPLAIGSGGADSPLRRDLEVELGDGAHDRLMRYGLADEVAATGYMLDALPMRGVRFRPHDVLDKAVEVVGSVPTSRGGVILTRTAAGAPIASMRAAVAAVAALRTGPQPGAKPMTRGF